MKEDQVRPGTPSGTEEDPATQTTAQNRSPGVVSETQKARLGSPAEMKTGRPGSPNETQRGLPGTGSGTQKARRSGRISKEVPILIFGNDADGRVFTEETRTVVLSLHGAGIVSRQRLIPEQELVLRTKEANREAVVRVVGEIAQQGQQYTYGVAFLDEKLDFWQIEFPPPSEWDVRPAVLTLECGGCGSVVELLNGDFEYDICAVHGGLTRFCEECGLLTVWRQSHEVMPTVRRAKRGGKARADLEGRSGGAEAPPLHRHRTEDRPLHGNAQSDRAAVEERPVESAMEPVILPIAMPAKEAERRARVRAKVNFFACVRSEMFEEEIVTCIDMARGGVSFRSRNCHVVGTTIQIAVPFAAEERKAPAIFVEGRIANVKEMGQGTYRCGVEFVR